MRGIFLARKGGQDICIWGDSTPDLDLLIPPWPLLTSKDAKPLLTPPKVHYLTKKKKKVTEICQTARD